MAGDRTSKPRILLRPSRASIRYVRAAERGRALTDRWRGQTGLFFCVLAHTDTGLVPGVSAAGASVELRASTPAADAEVILYGTPRCIPQLPSSPLGPPGPAGITRAAVELSGMPVEFAGAGLRVWPAAPCLHLPCGPGRRVDLDTAVPEAHALFEAGLALGRDLAGRCPYLVIGESVPGGTTTALALLLALGIPAHGRVSGSLPDNAHPLKSMLAEAGLRRAGLALGDGRADPLGAVREIGDPMQPTVAGIVIGAAGCGRDVLLAGGSQLVAVAALVAALEGHSALARVALGTTGWVVDDPAADAGGLAAEVWSELPVLAANLDFSHSRHAGLREYQRLAVKEGVGAGGASIAAMLATGVEASELERAIDDAYDEVLVSSR
jgi:uncharacterized protein (TIGR00303 family)